MAILDIQIVASSLTNMGSALAIPIYRLTWIQTGYLMAEVIAIPLTGLLTRALTLRWMFVLATLGFTLASLGCALSTDITAMIAIRVLQGFCGGMLIPPVFTSVFIMLPEKHRVSGHHRRGRCRDDRPGHRAGDRRLSYRDIFLALDIPDQYSAGPFRGRDGGLISSASARRIIPLSEEDRLSRP